MNMLLCEGASGVEDVKKAHAEFITNLIRDADLELLGKLQTAYKRNPRQNAMYLAMCGGKLDLTELLDPSSLFHKLKSLKANIIVAKYEDNEEEWRWQRRAAAKAITKRILHEADLINADKVA